MDINRVNSLGAMGSPSLREIPRVSTQDVHRQDEERRLSEVSIPSAGRETQAALAAELKTGEPERKLSPGELSLTFNTQEDFDYLGSSSDIRGLDMEKAISDMKKDQILRQYQYFVGSAKNVFGSLDDGFVIPKF